MTRLVPAVDVELHELDLLRFGVERLTRPSNVVVGSTSGAIAGGPSCVPALDRWRDARRAASAVRRLEMISQSAKGLGAGHVVEMPVAQHNADCGPGRPSCSIVPRMVRARSTDTCVS